MNNERVIYYLRELGLQKTQREYMQFESYRRKLRIARRARRDKEREARRRVRSSIPARPITLSTTRSSPGNVQ